ncbi:phosphoribosylanthranilate isomerase, partial [Fulvivirga sp. RKSG066]|uniref:phosphoribosylanthranilate isomerase n=1 Tax=Fulvivirga aurantia TaxID=2529383 RepID=UPI0012BD32E8
MSERQMKLKVCGLRDNLAEVVKEIEPDMIGLIFYEKSPRYVADLQPDQLPANVERVGVFVNAEYEFIKSKINEYQLDYVQLHGDETRALCSQLQAHAKVIKVFSGNGEIDKSQLKAYESSIDYYLFDTRDKQQYGGTGNTFDWEKLSTLNLDKPIILSGGVSLENIEEVRQLEGVDIYAIDVNSKFEDAPGLKNIALLKTL